ncbi:MAG: type II toxin-antitoxin system prevent-host-death family antitoxin [Rickettsiales bacterium]
MSRNKEMPLKTVSIQHAQQNWSALLEQVKTEPVTVVRDDELSAVMLSYKTYKELTKNIPDSD